jgi:hypothetical protein
MKDFSDIGDNHVRAYLTLTQEAQRTIISAGIGTDECICRHDHGLQGV